MVNRNLMLVVAFIFKIVINLNAQHILPNADPPQIGKPMPDFKLTHVTHYKAKEVTLKDFSGKWLFLEFWFPGCTSCIKSIVDVNQLQRRLSRDIEFLFVGYNTRQYQTIKVYERLQQRYDLRLISAYDSLVTDSWGIHAMPHIIIIDPTGVVRVITNGQDMTAEKMRDLIDGKQVSFNPSGVERPSYDISKFPGSPDNSLVYRSILTKWNRERSTGSEFEHHIRNRPEYRKQGIKLVGYPLARLYMMAYFGDDSYNVKISPDGGLMYPHPAIEVRDPKNLLYDTTYHDTEGIYNYNLAVPESKGADLEYLKKIFQQELKNVFGYEVVIEQRTISIWTLRAKPGAVQRMKTKGGTRVIDISPIHIEMRNAPMETFCKVVVSNLANLRRIFVDENETGFTGNIDVKLDAILTDVSEMRTALQQIGFDLIEEKRNVKVLVIRDPLKG